MNDGNVVSRDGTTDAKIHDLERELDRLRHLLEKAMQYSEADPEVFLSQSRKTTEAICRAIHRNESDNRPGVPVLKRRASLDDMIQLLVTNDLVPKHMQVHLRTIQGFGNYGSHDQASDFVVSNEFIQPCLQAFTTFTYWYFEEYLGRPYVNPLGVGPRGARRRGGAAPAAVRRLYFVQPFASRNDFFFDVQSRLSTLASSADDVMLVAVTPDSDHAEDLYLAAERTVATASAKDTVVLVPRDYHRAEAKELLDGLVARCRSRLVFFDQRPTDDLLEGENRFFVGADQQAIGYMAAAGIANSLESPADAHWVVFAGPGGASRWRGFRDAVRARYPNAEVEIEPIEDLDRYENFDLLDDIVAELPRDREIGLFAGNDENALAVLAALESQTLERWAIGGCDGTKEMRFRIDRSALPISTVDTHPDRQCAKLLHVAEFGGRRREVLQEPSLYPPDRRVERAWRKQQFKHS